VSSCYRKFGGILNHQMQQWSNLLDITIEQYEGEKGKKIFIPG
jgi:hypothetical protein